MAEKRYVEANALREDAMKRAGVSEFAFYNCYPYWQFSKSIDEAPSADVVEVKHAYWKTVSRYSRNWKMHITKSVCSNCGQEHEELPFQEFRFCPNCGAKMDGKEGKQ